MAWKTQVNYRKNIVRALYKERSKLKGLKKYKGCLNNEDVILQDKLISEGKAKIELLKSLLKPYKKFKTF